MKKVIIAILVLAMSYFTLGASDDGCDQRRDVKSNSGVTKASTVVQTDVNGLTVEQKNVAKRLVEDNKVGTTKHLYVISAYSGQVIIYSAVDGKITSSGKRLSPTTANSPSGYGFRINAGDLDFVTNEVLQDDGTYGSSEAYVYWWDTKGVYHQHYVSGGQILHVSSQPLSVKNIIINMSDVTER